MAVPAAGLSPCHHYFPFSLFFQAHHAPPASRSVPTIAPTTPAIVPVGVPPLLVFGVATVTVAGGGGGDCDVVEPGDAEDSEEELVAAAIAEEAVDSLEILK